MVCKNNIHVHIIQEDLARILRNSHWYNSQHKAIYLLHGKVPPCVEDEHQAWSAQKTCPGSLLLLMIAAWFARSANSIIHVLDRIIRHWSVKFKLDDHVHQAQAWVWNQVHRTISPAASSNPLYQAGPASGFVLPCELLGNYTLRYNFPVESPQLTVYPPRPLTICNQPYS